jgi:hypothetical protein
MNDKVIVARDEFRDERVLSFSVETGVSYRSIAFRAKCYPIWPNICLDCRMKNRRPPQYTDSLSSRTKAKPRD